MLEHEAPIVVGLGELLWDLFDDSRRPGGAPANVAFQAGQLGCRGIVCSRVGVDPLGDELCEYLADHGLETANIQRDAEFPTGTVTVDTSNHGHPEFTIHENVAWDRLEFTTQIQQLMQQADAVCFGTLAQRSPISRETIARCLLETSESCLLVYDVNLRQHWYDGIWIERSLQSADIVKLNDQEVEVVAHALQLETADPVKLAEVMQRQFDVSLVCVTRAEHGCLLCSRDLVIDMPGLKVDVSDAVGAGDAFTAALIAAQLRGWSLNSTAEFANRVGALVASRPGAMPVIAAELRELRGT